MAVARNARTYTFTHARTHAYTHKQKTHKHLYITLELNARTMQVVCQIMQRDQLNTFTEILMTTVPRTQ
jgi:hypothetical protein